MNKQWWRGRVVYQIYPRSFCDSNNDGIGDIQGIISKLDYLQELGVGAIWLSPVYATANRDFGYDISDYKAVNPEYGTLDDMKQLFAEAAKRDIKVVMDLVVNHTSDQHEWFQKARDPKSKYRDYYIWQKPGRSWWGREVAPNNWQSVFTGSAWSRDGRDGDYYLHLFTKHQPDLNYNNPEVIKEIKKVMRYWLELGAAGFRCDVINLIGKESLNDGRRRIMSQGKEHYSSTALAHSILKEFNREVWQPFNAFTVGELHEASIQDVQDFTGGDELSTAFYFGHMVFPLGFDASAVKKQIMRIQTQLDWPTVFWENHDGWRSVSRFGGEGKYHFAAATMLATVLLTLRGTAFIYQGQEIGMTNAPFGHMAQIRDVITQKIYLIGLRWRLPHWLAFKIAMLIGRDNARTPMQWSDEENAGFSQETPWLLVNPNYRRINVASQRANANSIWRFYQRLLAHRNRTEAWKTGHIAFRPSPRRVLIYDRTTANERYRIMANMTSSSQPLPEGVSGLVISSNYQRKSYRRVKRLKPFEAAIVEVA